jgi:RNA polymerase sigma factor (sigma-70 family)
MERSEPVYGTAVRDEPSTEELEAARLGFRQMLRRKRFSAHFIQSHCEELLARARFEYSRAVRRGEEIRSPAGWIINCAWRRTQNQLESESREPQLVSTERAPDVVDHGSPGPEQAAIEADRARTIEAAMAKLSSDQRTLIELAYFEGLSVREAGRVLGWHSSKAQRTHESALRRLREALGLSDLDELEVEIGLAAWVSLSAGKQVLPAVPGLDTLAEAGSRGAHGVWAKGHELARRVLLGAGEPSSAMAAGAGARAAGVCGAAAAAVCLAGGVVGPGVGGVAAGLGRGQHEAEPAKVRVAKPPVAEVESATPPSVQPETVEHEAGAATEGPKTTGAPSEAAGEPTGAAVERGAPTSGVPQTEPEFGGFGAGTAATEQDANPVPLPPPANRGASPPPSGDAAGGGSGVEQEFGALR